ncbi:MAG: ROK family protein [Nitrospira sp.]|nr:ROK family protein [Nitrospira sp.]MBS0166709.1 ROK family protein [Nitrospira sp.]
MRQDSGSSPNHRKVLVIDVGGTNVKVLATGRSTPRKIPSGPTMMAKDMVDAVKRATVDWAYDAVSIGYPGPVWNGRPAAEPEHLGKGWVEIDFQKAFGKPVRVINDAAMQALGSYQGGRMLFLGLGTGLGSALVIDGVLAPMELAHLPYSKGRTYEHYVGLRGLKRCGKKKWRRQVGQVTQALRRALQVEYVVLGGGNAKRLKRLPKDVHLGNNKHAFTGGFRLWEKAQTESGDEA